MTPGHTAPSPYPVALEAGATREEILMVFKSCVAEGVQACNLGVPILAEELGRHAKAGQAKAEARSKS